MSLGRRLELPGWANRSGAWVIEDDYDSEYRYTGRPLETLQGLDGEVRVLYVVTFSKVLFPALRLGYLVVPQDLIEAFVSARELTDRHPPTVDQAVLAHFIAEGHFLRHLRQMRALYAKRQAALVRETARELGGLLDVNPAAAGMHLVGWLPEGADDREASRRPADLGVEAPPVSLYGSVPGNAGGSCSGTRRSLRGRCAAVCGGSRRPWDRLRVSGIEPRGNGGHGNHRLKTLPSATAGLCLRQERRRKTKS